MTIEKQFGKAVAWMATGSWIEQALNIGFFIFLARILGPEIVGLAAMAVTFVIFAESLVRESLSEFLISQDDLEDGHLSAAFWMLSALGAVLTIGLIALSGLIADFYGEPVVQNLLIVFSGTVFLVATNAVPVAILRRNMQFAVMSVRAVAGIFIGGLCGLALALAGFGVWALVIQQVVLIGVNAGIAWACAGWRPILFPQRRYFRDVSGFGGAVLGLRLAELIATQTPLVLIGATLGATALGIFTVSWRLIEIGSFLIISPIRMASQSAFALLNRSDGDASALLVDILRITSLAAFPAFLGLAVIAEPLVLVMFGQGWATAGPVLAILSFVGLYFCIEKTQQSFCLAAGRIGTLTVLSWLDVVVGIILILLASRYGLVAVTTAVALRYYLLWPFRFRVVAIIGKTSGMELFGHILPPAILALAMAAVIAGIDLGLGLSSPILRIGVGMVVGSAFFAIVTYLFVSDRVALLRKYLAV